MLQTRTKLKLTKCTAHVTLKDIQVIKYLLQYINYRDIIQQLNSWFHVFWWPICWPSVWEPLQCSSASQKDRSSPSAIQTICNSLDFSYFAFFSDFEETFRIVSYSFLVLSLLVALFQALMPSLELVAWWLISLI